MKQVFSFLRQYSYRTGYWNGTTLTCYDGIAVNTNTDLRAYHSNDEEWETLEEHLFEAFGEAKRWFHV